MFLDKNEHVLYVGKAKNLKSRVSSYFVNPDQLLVKTKLLVEQTKKINITIVESELESLLLEANRIKKYKPKYNVRLADGKSYATIKITVKEKYPAVLTAHQPGNDTAVYFGPYPNATAMRMVLRTIRRIFPFQSVANHPKRICLYHHLGLCPCPPMLTSSEEKKEYKKTVNHIIHFLNGQTKRVIKDLEHERDVFSKKESFEKADTIQKQIDAIGIVTEPFYNPLEYETNPNLTDDLRKQETDELKKILNLHGVPVTNLHRIECYDISNIQGRAATGSMVVFTDAEKDGSQYRRFKIRFTPTDKPNDFAMMKEVVMRRLKHVEWEQPSLIVIDGGKGQISAAMEGLHNYYNTHVISSSLSEVKDLKYRDSSTKPQNDKQNMFIPLVGLAKRQEIIITPDFQEIRLPKNSHALQLVMRIRDEAHRFAISYHRNLRSKRMLS